MTERKRKRTRLDNYDYNTPGAYFITICPKDRKAMLSSVDVGKQNSTISRFISTFKRFCNRDIGYNIWQYRSYDHIIRGEQDYREIWQYIEDNPVKWTQDRLYVAVVDKKEK